MAPRRPRSPIRAFAAIALALLALAAAPARAQSGELDLAVESFGIGGVVRSGEWAAVRVVTADRAPTPRTILIRLSVSDPDGDRPVYQRAIASTPGEPRGAWLYLRLPFWFQAGDAVRVSVYAAEETAEGHRPGRLLAQTVATPRNVLDKTLGMIGVISDDRAGGAPMAGLEQYAVRLPGQTYAPEGHESLHVAAGIRPLGLSDQWMGLAQFDTLVWTTGQPGDLDVDRARAIREWVERGGHLVIVLPPVGQAWVGAEAYNPLADILPRVTARRLEGISLEPYRPLLAPDAADAKGLTGLIARAMPSAATVHEFEPIAGAEPWEAIRVLRGPPLETGRPGGCIVARRLVGTGMVTLVGIDAASRQLQVHADIFWHRVLGRRGKLPTQQELNDRAYDFSAREPSLYDRMIGGIIDKRGRASAGVLLGFVVFIAYWLMAAPVSYALLRRFGLTRHSWVVYAGVAALFTAIAWGGATAIRPSRVEGTHLTLLDHVYGQRAQRTRTWVSLLIPWYGDATVRLEPPSEEGTSRFTNLIAPWDPPTSTGAGASFPDAREYAVDSRSPAALRFPTRATVKQLQIDWAGGPRWEMPRPVAGPDDPAPGTIRLIQRATGGGEIRPTLWGTLVHRLPGPLANVTIIVVRGQTPIGTGRGPELLADAEAWQLAGEWAPGAALDLSAATTRSPGEPLKLASAYLQGLVLSSLVGDGRILGAGDEQRALTALGFLSQMEAVKDKRTAAQRSATHGWDLGEWFTQPCVIVVGHLGATNPAPCPTPIFVDGEAPPVLGRTVVRWIYPLAENPPRWRGTALPESEDDR